MNRETGAGSSESGSIGAANTSISGPQGSGYVANSAVNNGLYEHHQQQPIIQTQSHSQQPQTQQQTSHHTQQHAHMQHHGYRNEINANEYPFMGDTNSPAYSATPSTPRYEIFANFAPPAVGSMKYKNLGKSGLQIPTVGFGLWSAFGTRLSDQAAEELVSVAYENGCNYFDTGDAFVNGRSEVMLGNILRKRGWKRNTYMVSTKLFWNNGPSATAGGCGLSRKMLTEALEASLRRLQLRYVDIVIINKLDGMCPMEEIVRTMGNLIDRGLTFYWGTSRWSPVHIMEAFSVARQFNCPPPTCEQMEYHMFTREKMELYMPELYHKVGVGSIVWSPFSLNNDEGIAFISKRSLKTDVKTNIAQGKLAELNGIISKLSCDMTQFTTAWSLRNENVNCILIAPRSLDQLYSQLNTIKLISKLTPAILEEVEKVLDNRPMARKIVPSGSVHVSLAPNGCENGVSTSQRESATNL
ncbi:voltage-gated potassium channel subunit beta-2 isoform X3 [Tetranychus urticae]|nr:voltage-gated potassium channel subunit beta-2 isoform X3 [Tetranychus urticae]XP_015790888.1 voltage-gated potassium channel subunit beta-2 isoform X3 [Tetranychus urticae]